VQAPAAEAMKEEVTLVLKPDSDLRLSRRGVEEIVA
jgi:hypothetical protein